MSTLIPCKACGESISKNAPTCPKCGEPSKGKKKQYGCGTLFLLGFLALFVYYLFQSNPSHNKSSKPANGYPPKQNTYDQFTRKGYFKSGTRDRVFTIEMSPGTTKESAQSYALRQPYTQGQMSAVYFYDQGSVIPIDGVTLARNIFEIKDVMRLKGLSKWHFAFMKFRNGDSVVVDCFKTPSDALCWSVQ